ncbi:PaaI family thioesterase [Streptomyces sp. NPDC056121]|uniref:PaaI family thioesterase n=1 Tax=Streptomyces TaxID=1883 RepID=UPI001D0A21B8|nr:PaaI family thioesterase [Streptomyces longhuiensis]UDM04263.1 PaaI family thioesterase [Streptomyces longhuiensis]
MTERSGPFWDVVEGRAPLPRAAATLGLEVLDADGDDGTVELAFTATEDFTNPAGNVLGAFLAAMLYDTVGSALLATLGPDRFQSTLELHTCFLRPVRPGRIVGTGRVVHRAGDIAFLEGSLVDSDGVVIATAGATARVIPLDQAPTSA